MKNRKDRVTAFRVFSLGFVLLLTVQCSHKYNSDDLDLTYYQWNMWAGDGIREGDGAPEPAPPSCGWEEFNRGVGQLVRIPAPFTSQFTEEENQGVLWYHCRFTLPEMWEARTIRLYLENAGPRLDLFLNEQLVVSDAGEPFPLEVEITDQVFYVRDNHLAIKVSSGEAHSDPAAFGILGKVIVKSSLSSAQQGH